MTLIAPVPASVATDRQRSWLAARLALAVIVYMLLLATVWLASDARIQAGALLVVVTLMLVPGLRRRRRFAWITWMLMLAGGGLLIASSHARLLIDLVPMLVSAALCAAFAVTLLPPRQPFIAHAIVAIDGPDRLRQHGVARYARWLTLAWAALFGLQALIALLLALCVMPDGLLALAGVQPPVTVDRSVMHTARAIGLAVLIAFFVLEYAFRRWHMRHLEQIPAHAFVSRLVHHWPELLRGGSATMRATTPVVDTAGSPADWMVALSVSDTHPSLPGHFPGNPVVPGVVLLDRVAAALEKAGFGSIRRFASVKFIAPLRPGHEVALRLQAGNGRVRFSVTDGERIIMRGEGELA